jgi:VanZ family protein
VSAVLRTGPRGQREAALRAWLLVVAWIAVILLLSSEAFSAASTGSLLRPLLRWLFPDWSAEAIRTLHFAIRKLAHISVYGVLALLGFRALRLSFEATLLRHAGLALALVLAAAATDEYHQSLTRRRTGTLWDVGYDVLGGAVALALLLLWQRARGALRRRAERV